MNVIGNPDWTRPAVRLKNSVAAPFRRALAQAGRWSPLRPDECETIQTDVLTVAGDQPEQRRLVYAVARPEREFVDNLLYTPQGMAVAGGKITERFSIRAPSVPEILGTPGAPTRTISTGTIIESQTPYTYGDWVGDVIRALVTAQDALNSPIVLPRFLAEKPYVRRDIAALGLDLISAEAPVLIERATVLRKQLPSYYWSEADIAAYRKAFNVAPPPAKAGSMTYLGRYGLESESVAREYPTETVAEIMRSLGGDIFDARKSSPAAFDEMAMNMETVIADQGSAVFGVMHWRTKNVIELARRGWWHNANLFIAKGAGVENYAVIVVDGLDKQALRMRIEGHLKDFGALLSN